MYAISLVTGRGGGEQFTKTFSISYMSNSKNKQIENDVVTAIRQSKKSPLDNLANMFKKTRSYAYFKRLADNP